MTGKNVNQKIDAWPIDRCWPINKCLANGILKKEKKRKTLPDVVAHVYNHGTQDAEAG